MQTRISTKYKLLTPPSPKTQSNHDTKSNETTSPTTYPARAILTLKTFDTASGACLKYRTDKGAEVGRLFATLGRLGKRMAGLPEAEDLPIDDGAAPEMTENAVAPEAEKPVVTAKDTAPASKKKKKGKK
jgi:hypothetical protein